MHRPFLFFPTEEHHSRDGMLMGKLQGPASVRPSSGGSGSMGTEQC